MAPKWLKAITLPEDQPDTWFRVEQSQIIDFMKGTTALAILSFIAYYNAWDNPTAWVYFGIHGSCKILNKF
jgi:hypothetical protein